MFESAVEYEQYLVMALLALPALAAVLMLFFKDGIARKVLTYTFAGLTAVCSIVLFVTHLGASYTIIEVPEQVAKICSYVGIGISVIIAGAILFFG